MEYIVHFGCTRTVHRDQIPITHQKHPFSFSFFSFSFFSGGEENPLPVFPGELFPLIFPEPPNGAELMA
jgi:hypothetical protein